MSIFVETSRWLEILFILGFTWSLLWTMTQMEEKESRTVCCNTVVLQIFAFYLKALVS